MPLQTDQKLSLPPKLTAELPCVSCGTQVLGRYCVECGQRKAVGKISWGSLAHELSVSYFGLDSKLIRTFGNLCFRPAAVISSFLAGDRVRFLGPLTYYLIMTAFTLLVFSLLGVRLENFIQNSGGDFFGTVDMTDSKAREAVELQGRVIHYMALIFRFIAIILVPFYALVAWLVFRKKRLHLLEHTVVMLYIVSHASLFSLLHGIVFKITGQAYTEASIFLSTLYCGFVYQQLLGKKEKLAAFCKGVAVYLLGMFIFILILTFLAIAALMLGWLK